jgi:membrane-bound hydrogenase subunit mbhJ
MLPRVIRVFEQIPAFKVVVAIGNCAINGCVFSKSEMIVGPVDKHIPVDSRVHGCPPRPEEIIKGVLSAVELRLAIAGVTRK